MIVVMKSLFISFSILLGLNITYNLIFVVYGGKGELYPIFGISCMISYNLTTFASIITPNTKKEKKYFPLLYMKIWYNQFIPNFSS